MLLVQVTALLGFLRACTKFLMWPPWVRVGFLIIGVETAGLQANSARFLVHRGAHTFLLLDDAGRHRAQNLLAQDSRPT